MFFLFDLNIAITFLRKPKKYISRSFFYAILTENLNKRILTLNRSFLFSTVLSICVDEFY